VFNYTVAVLCGSLLFTIAFVNIVIKAIIIIHAGKKLVPNPGHKDSEVGFLLSTAVTRLTKVCELKNYDSKTDLQQLRKAALTSTLIKQHYTVLLQIAVTHAWWIFVTSANKYARYCYAKQYSSQRC